MTEPHASPLWRRITTACSLAARAAPGRLALYVGITLVAGVLPVAAAWLTKLLVDALVRGAELGTLLGLGSALAAVGVVGGVTPQVNQYLRAEMDREVGLLTQDRLFTAVERFVGIGRFEDPHFLDRLRLAQQTGSGTPNQTVDGALGIIRATLTVSGFIGSLLLLNPLMTTLVLAAGLPTLAAEIVLSRRRARMLWDIGPAERRELFYGQLLSSVEAAKEVRL
ncbi:hypothetical protein [Streptomyces sp. NRRL S-481]|nr:hypothetical protein [Streptomyces sp. NRRL S-481]